MVVYPINLKSRQILLQFLFPPGNQKKTNKRYLLSFVVKKQLIDFLLKTIHNKCSSIFG